MGWLSRVADAFAGAVSPSWALKRRYARVALANTHDLEWSLARTREERAIGWREGTFGRLDPAVLASGASADWSAEVGYDRRNMVDRARQIERSNLLAGSLLDRSTEHVVGTGYELKLLSKDSGYNKEGEEMWREWCENDCDSRGEMSFAELMACYYRSYLRDGDVALLLERNGSLRIVESDEIASPQGGYYRTTQADGVELDRRGRPIAFWVYEPDETPYSDRRRAVNRLRRIPAADMLFLARRYRAGQTRGMTAFNGCFWVLEQIDGVLEAVTTSYRMAASFGLFVKKKSPIDGTVNIPDGTGVQRQAINIEPGAVTQLEPDEDIGQVKAEHPAGTFEMHLKVMVRLCGTRFSLALEHVTLDWTGVNFSNARAGEQEVRNGTKIKQQKMARTSTHVLDWKFLNFMRERKLRPRLDGLDHVWRLPARDWLDPVAEAQSEMAAIDYSLMTRTQALARRGLTWEDVAEQLATEQKKLKELGLPDVRGTLTRDPTLPNTDDPRRRHDVPTSNANPAKPDAEKKNGASQNGVAHTGRRRLPV